MGACANPTPMITSYLRSAKARIAGSMLTGVPGSTSRTTTPSAGLPQSVPSGSLPLSAHFIPFHAAALNDLSSFPPMSNTMPASVTDGSLTAYDCGLQAERNTHDRAEALCHLCAEARRRKALCHQHPLLSALCPLLSNLCTLLSALCSLLSSYHFVNNQRRSRRRQFADAHSIPQQRQRVGQPLLRSVVHAQHRVTGGHRVADGRSNHDTDRWIDLIIYFVSPTAERHNR